MANLTPVQSPDLPPQLEITTVALGGPGQIMNAQAQALLNRVEYYRATSNNSSFNAQVGTSYTPVLSDMGLTITCSNVSPITLTVPPNSSVAFPIGTNIDVIQDGPGKLTIAPGAGVTINSVNGNKVLAGQYCGATLRKESTNTWYLLGALTPI